MRPLRIAVMRSWLTTAVMALALVYGAQASTPPIVQTREGAIEGVVREGVDAFMGIPFAAPPVGKLRWRAPQPAEAWTGALLATHYRPACMQEGMYPPDAPDEAVSENCLYLNIWKPAQESPTPLPVMVWIYGGGLQNGSGAVPLYAGNQLARHGVIVVTANYRLGVFGFLALPALTAKSAHHSSGNFGLLDQIAALKWVHENIAAFGGDPADVTVFGQSSGSISISALTASPLTKGLFQRVIGESGGLFEPMELTSQFRLIGAEREGKRFMVRAGAQSLAALREIPADKLLRARFSPHIIIDGYVLPRAPWKAYAEHMANKVSLLIGWNADEGAIFLTHTRVTPANYDRLLEQSFPSVLVHLLAPPPGNDNQSARAAAVAFNTDMRFRWDMWRWALLASRNEDDRVYLYEFTRAPPYPVNSPYYGLGATHGVEMPYVFDHLNPQAVNWTAADRRLAQVIPSYWTRFARTGNPNSSGLPHWPQFEPDRQRLMRLGTRIVAEPLSDIRSLRKISDVYRAARFAVAHSIFLIILGVIAFAALLVAIKRFIHHRLSLRRRVEMGT